MPRNPKSKTPRKKITRPKTGGVRALRVPIRRADKITSREVERAIEKALESRETDVFGGSDTLVLVLETFKK